MTDIALGHVTTTLNLPQSGSTTPVPVDAVQSVTFTPATLEMNADGQALNNAFTADFTNGRLTYQGEDGVHLYPGAWTVTFIPSLNHTPIELFVTPGAEINLFDWNDNSNVIVPTKDAADGDLLDWDGEKPAWIPPTEIKGIGTAAFQNISAFATAAQGSKADTALQEANYDAVKQAADDAKASAAQSAADAHAAQVSASDSQNGAQAYAAQAGNSATAASNSAGTATTQATAAINSATTATTQAGIATTQAGIATTQATAASTSATNAQTSATHAATSATQSAIAAQNAQTSATQATSNTPSLQGDLSLATGKPKMGRLTFTGASTTVTFSQPFSSSCDGVLITDNNYDPSSFSMISVGKMSSSGFTIYLSDTSSTHGHSMVWAAYGH